MKSSKIISVLFATMVFVGLFSSSLFARQYDQRTGRFNRRDPIGYVESVGKMQVNLYTYAVNNPVNFTDPTGMTVRYFPVAGEAVNNSTHNVEICGDYNYIELYLKDGSLNLRGPINTLAAWWGTQAYIKAMKATGEYGSHTWYEYFDTFSLAAGGTKTTDLTWAQRNDVVDCDWVLCCPPGITTLNGKKKDVKIGPWTATICDDPKNPTNLIVKGRWGGKLKHQKASKRCRSKIPKRK